jgi:hypothetical protein
MVTRLDRLARSTRDLPNTLAAIADKKADCASFGVHGAEPLASRQANHPEGRLGPFGAPPRSGAVLQTMACTNTYVPFFQPPKATVCFAGFDCSLLSITTATLLRHCFMLFQYRSAAVFGCLACVFV